ncbi:hypothetical protein [Cohnella fermenti]|uniref:hypothetical protein n=1 Tax=Cohnella fermenti TaxID=2565925 RepID=UPI001454D588|nr:hypothetical protein [Cohnella fermenti]
MNRTRVKTFRHQVGKNRYIVIHIYQSASASSDSGNALASNALNIKIERTASRRR